jgi:phosphatidylcholine synthase
MLNGARLDDIVDYLTFVFAPAFALHHGGLLPAGLAGWVVVAAMLVSSALGFSREDAKTADHFFTGFPSYWNIVAIYLVALGLSGGVNAAILLVLAAAVFVPIGYVYPSRTPRLRGLTVSLGVVWGLVLLGIICRLPHAPRWLVLTSLAYPVYYVGLSLALQRSRTSSPGSSGSSGKSGWSG